MSDTHPAVSVIIATYNRSNALAYAIRSVLWSTFTDWELLVVGDACTDDTEEVVESFKDGRIRFVNLEENTGEQSGPNNEGFRLARGSYVAYLNHDDLWLPDHLEAAVGGIEESGADMVFTLLCAVGPAGERELMCLAPEGRYEPQVDVPPSCWLTKREFLEEMGPWRSHRRSYNVPSQELLFRAWKARKEIRLVPRMTVLHIPSSRRKDAYAQREVEENRRYFERMSREVDFREKVLAECLLRGSARSGGSEVLGRLRRAVRSLYLRLLIAAGVHPLSVTCFLASPRKGGLIERRRRLHGLAKGARPSALKNRPKSNRPAS